MLNKITLITASSLGLAAVTLSPAFAFPQDFVGTWVNTNKDTRGITRLIVEAPEPNKLTVRAFAKCYPNECDMGVAELTTYGKNPEDPNHKFATAKSESDTTTAFYVLRVTSTNRIAGQSFVKFKDNSGRQNYQSQDDFKRVK